MTINRTSNLLVDTYETLQVSPKTQAQNKDPADALIAAKICLYEMIAGFLFQSPGNRHLIRLFGEHLKCAGCKDLNEGFQAIENGSRAGAVLIKALKSLREDGDLVKSFSDIEIRTKSHHSDSMKFQHPLAPKDKPTTETESNRLTARKANAKPNLHKLHLV